MTDSIKYAKNIQEALLPAITGLKKDFPEMKVYEIDERFTSSMALQTMIVGGMKKKDRQVKGTVDTISATIILQSFLEQKNNKVL